MNLHCENKSILDKEKIGVDGLSVYIEKFDKCPEVDFNRMNLNFIQDICITSILQRKDLLCRSVIIKKEYDDKKYLLDQFLTWIKALSILIKQKKKVLIIVHREVCEMIRKEIYEMTRVKVVSFFSKQEEDLENVDVLITTPTYGSQFLFKKKLNIVFDILLIDECLKFNESNYFRNVYEIIKQVKEVYVDRESNKGDIDNGDNDNTDKEGDFMHKHTINVNNNTTNTITTNFNTNNTTLYTSPQVIIFSTTFSKDNFETVMSPDRVVVEVESLGPIVQEASYVSREDLVYQEAMRVIKEGKYNFKGSWRDEIEKDKILIIVRDYNKIEGLLKRERLSFKTLNFEGKKGDLTREEILFRDGVIDGFRNGTYPILIVNRYSTRNLNISNLSLVLSLDFSDNIRDYLFRSTLLKKGGKLMTFVSEDNSPHFLEDLICTFEVNKVQVPDFLRRMKTKVEKHKPKIRRHKKESQVDIVEELEKIHITEDKDISDDEQLNVWG